MTGGDNSRRSFLLSGGGVLTAAWVSANWPAIAAAAHHADESAASVDQAFQFFDAAQAADVEAIGAQIVPSGTTPGAREARAVNFIDRALSTFFADWAAGFRAGLREFQTDFAARNPDLASFAKASPERQLAYLKTADSTPFFETVRTLTVLGMFSSPKYGGNFGRSGWTLMGFADQHAFTPPFGYYDREYTGFVPYAGGGRS
jgi:gluconate 2-dehydrogenase gamma chain